MQTHSLRTRFIKSGPPTLEKAPQKSEVEVLDSRATVTDEEDGKLGKTLKAMASLALVLAPQGLEAAETAAVAATEVEEVVVDEDLNFIDRMESRLDSWKDNAAGLKDKLDPNGYLDEREFKVGEYDFRMTPVDLDLSPRWKDGGPALKFDGEILETSLSKKDDIGGGWTRRQGVSGRLQGEITTYDDAELDIEAGVFRDYQGPVGENFTARFRNHAGIRHRFIGEEEGLRAGVSFRQELEGGDYQFMGQDFSLYAEGRQSAYYNFETGEPDLSYSFMAGPKKDFDLKVLGREGKLTVTVGPEIKGSTRGEAFDVGVESKVRVRF